MQGLLEKFSFTKAKQDLPQIKPGQTVKVYQKVKEGAKERIQVFEGLVIAMHRKQGTNATITVRKESYGVGVERVFPLSAPFIEKIEVVKEAKVRRAKLFYMRKLSGKKARMKTKAVVNNGIKPVSGEVNEASEEIGETKEINDCSGAGLICPPSSETEEIKKETAETKETGETPVENPANKQETEANPEAKTE